METTRLFDYFTATNPGLSPFVTRFLQALVKAHKLKIRLNFLKECLLEQVLPKTFLPKRIVEMAERPFDDFQRLILSKQIEMAKVELQQAFKISKAKKSDFQAVIPNEWKNTLLDYCFSDLRSKCNLLKNKLNQKLTLLIENSKWTQDANPDFVINLSDRVIDQNTTSALGYGLSFVSGNDECNSVDIVKGFINLEKYGSINNDDLNICKGIVYGSMAVPSVPKCPKRFEKAFSKLKKDENIHITKADKSNAIVIMNKIDYNEKMGELLRDESTYQELQRDPLEDVNSNFNKKIKKLLKGDDQLIKQLITTSATLPYMYGLVKTHKPNNPMRPIISSVGSCSYKLSKYIVKLLNPLLGTISDSHVKNNVDLVEKLNSLNVTNDFKLVSFDVTSLFTKVPVDDLLEFLEEKLETVDLPHSARTIIDLIKLCIKECKFTFNDKFYSQRFGMAMGNPLSPILSNLYMEFFESRILSNILPRGVTWLRYVDDILCLWPTNYDIDEFLVNINDLVPSIKFTLEIERDCTIPFLDVNIHRVDRRFKFSIYRKPTNVLSYVHFYSSQHKTVKLSVFSSMFLRALRICSPEYVDEEIDEIYRIASKLKYPKRYIDQSLVRAKKTFYNVKVREPYDFSNLLVLPYNDNFSKISSLLKDFKVNVVFRSSNTVKEKLIKNSPVVSNGCVYKVPCSTCDMFYVGQTGKSLTTRLNQHKYSIRTGQDSNALFAHIRDCDHPIAWNNAHSVVKCKGIIERNIIESSLIKHHREKVFNLSPGLYKLDGFVIKKIVANYKVTG